jgi:hypothetical protein
MISLEPVAQQTRWCPDNYDGQEQSEKELVPRFKEILGKKFIVPETPPRALALGKQRAENLRQAHFITSSERLGGTWLGRMN